MSLVSLRNSCCRKEAAAPLSLAAAVSQGVSAQTVLGGNICFLELPVPCVAVGSGQPVEPRAS